MCWRFENAKHFGSECRGVQSIPRNAKKLVVVRTRHIECKHVLETRKPHCSMKRDMFGCIARHASKPEHNSDDCHTLYSNVFFGSEYHNTMPCVGVLQQLVHSSMQHWVAQVLWFPKYLVRKRMFYYKQIMHRLHFYHCCFFSVFLMTNVGKERVLWNGNYRVFVSQNIVSKRVLAFTLLRRNTLCVRSSNPRLRVERLRGYRKIPMCLHILNADSSFGHPACRGTRISSAILRLI